MSESRLVTLTGVGGVGKSRLALHVAHELRRAFPDGIWLAELAAVHDPAQVPRAVAVALGLLETSAREPGDSLAGYLADASALRVLATSRTPLGLGAEHVCPVLPLSPPPALGSGSSAERRASGPGWYGSRRGRDR